MKGRLPYRRIFCMPLGTTPLLLLIVVVMMMLMPFFCPVPAFNLHLFGRYTCNH